MKRPNTVEQVVYGFIVALLFSGLFQLLDDGDTGILQVLLAGVTLGGILAFAASFLRLRVTSDAIVRVGALPSRRVSRWSVAFVARVPLITLGEPDGTVDVLVDAEGRCLMRFRSRLWNDGDLDRAWAAAGFKVQTYERPMDLDALAEWIPGSARSWEREPGMALAKLIGVGLTLVLAWAIVTP